MYKHRRQKSQFINVYLFYGINNFTSDYWSRVKSRIKDGTNYGKRRRTNGLTVGVLVWWTATVLGHMKYNLSMKYNIGGLPLRRFFECTIVGGHTIREHYLNVFDYQFVHTHVTCVTVGIGLYFLSLVRLLSLTFQKKTITYWFLIK